jgi:16S rRNA (guanine966-N2)-methyltransferase
MRITGGEFKGRRLHTDEGPGYRPATARVREAVFSMLQARGVDWPGVDVLDAFAGSGSMGIEALSRGARRAVFVERNKTAARGIDRNLSLLGLRRGRAGVLTRDVLSLLQKPPPSPFGLVFIDPPYGMDYLLPSLERLTDNGWADTGALVVAEVEAGLDVSAVSAMVEELVDKKYGQTRILIWKATGNARRSTPARSIP